MKAIYNIIAASVAALALMSCTKVISYTKNEPQAEGERIIAVSFANSTKTVLGPDGRTPQFQGGEQILVSNGTAYKKLTVEYDESSEDCYFKTNLSGTLKAVYPADAAVLKGCEIVGIQVPAEQSGRFEDANIAMAEMLYDGEKEILWFSNKTAVLRFYVDSSIGVTSIEIKGLKGSEIATLSDTIRVKMTERPTHAESVDSIATLIPLRPNPGMAPINLADCVGGRICYVAVLPGNYEKLNFTTTAYTQTLTDGIVEKTYENVKLAANSLTNVFIPYYIQVGDVKWAYCNVGAFLPEQPGYYYSWGDAQGHFLNNNYEEYSFLPDNYSFSSLETNIDPKSENDAAHKAWGDKWRMPTEEECKILLTNCVLNSSQYHFQGRQAFSIDKKEDYFILPATGCYQDNALDKSDEGFFWTSTIVSDKASTKSKGKVDEAPSTACLLKISANSSKIISAERFFGVPIRPVYDVSRFKINKYIEGPTI